MKFTFVVKLPNRNGGNSQTVIGTHPAPSVQALAEILNTDEFIVIDEVFSAHGAPAESNWPATSETILARRAIAKVRPYLER